MTDLEKRISAIEARNRKVEKDKKWETSYTRRILLILFTYIAISLYLNAINVVNPLLNAIVPSIGFWLSTLTLPLFRTIWERFIHKEK